MNANLEDPGLLESRLTLMGTLLGSPHKKNGVRNLQAPAATYV